MMTTFLDEIEDEYETPKIEKKIIGFSGIDPSKKINRTEVEQIIVERLSTISEIKIGE